MKCPVCGSKKFKEFRGHGRCGNCGYRHEARTVQETDNDKELDTHVNPRLSTQFVEPLADLHNICLKFRITKDTLVDWPKQEGFRGGGLQLLDYKGYKVKKTKNWLIIYNDKRNKAKLTDLENTYSAIEHTLVDLALEISHCYGFEIDKTPLSFSRNRPEVKTEFLASNNFYEAEAKSVYTSPGPIELIGKNSINNSINLTMMLTELRNSIMLETEQSKRQLEAINLEIQNKQKHDKVLESMLKTNEEMRDTLKQMRPKEKNPLEDILKWTIKFKEVMESS